VSAVELDDLRTELNEKIDRLPLEDIGDLSVRLDELQAQLGEKADVGEVAGLRTELARKVDSTTFTDRLGSLQSKVDRLENRMPPP
jgi:hypothetical protein